MQHLLNILYLDNDIKTEKDKLYYISNLHILHAK